MTSAELPIKIRPFRPEDEHWILSTWLRSAEADPRVSAEVYFSEHQRVIKALLRDPEVTTRIACALDDPDQTFAYVVAEPPVLHYAYTKAGFRKFGLSKRLMAEVFGDDPVTVHTNTSKMFPFLKTGSVFDPYAFR